MNDETKPWYQSRTIWGAIIAGVAAIAQAAGLSISESEQTQIITAVTGAGEMFGLLVVFLGRIKATKTVTITKSAGNA